MFFTKLFIFLGRGFGYSLQVSILPRTRSISRDSRDFVKMKSISGQDVQLIIARVASPGFCILKSATYSWDTSAPLCLEGTFQ